MDFGVFDWIDRDPLLLADNYEQRLQVLAAADALGYWCYHLAEHHGTPLGMAPAPGLFLAAASQRARRLALRAGHAERRRRRDEGDVRRGARHHPDGAHYRPRRLHRALLHLPG